MLGASCVFPLGILAYLGVNPVYLNQCSAGGTLVSLQAINGLANTAVQTCVAIHSLI